MGTVEYPVDVDLYGVVCSFMEYGAEIILLHAHKLVHGVAVNLELFTHANTKTVLIDNICEIVD